MAMALKSMAASPGNLTLVRQPTHHSVDLSNRVSNLGFSFKGDEKWKRKHRVKVRAIVEVDVEGLKRRSSVALEGTLGLDMVSEGELMVKGFRGLRKTKLVCTVGPACSSLEDLEKMALGGMNVARLNMCHGTREWHRDVIRKIKKLNEEQGFAVSVMIDTEGSQIHVVDHGAPSSVKVEVTQLILRICIFTDYYDRLVCVGVVSDTCIFKIITDVNVSLVWCLVSVHHRECFYLNLELYVACFILFKLLLMWTRHLCLMSCLYRLSAS